MNIFRSNIKRILRDRTSLLFMVILPVFFISMYFVATSAGLSGLKIGFIDRDQTPLSTGMEAHLASEYVLVEVEEENLSAALLDGEVDYAVIIPEGYTRDILEGNHARVQGYESLDNNVYRPFVIYLESYLEAIQTIGRQSGGNEEVFYQALEAYEEGIFQMTSVQTGNSTLHTERSMGFLIMGILFFSIRSTSLIMKDKKSKVFQRILTSPLHLKQYMLENILCFSLLMLIQIALILVVVAGVFRLPMGPSLINLFLVLFLFGVTSISLGISLVSLGKDQNRMATITTLIATPMLMLGGAFWPRAIMPELLQNIGRFIPVTWAMEGVERVLQGSSITDLWFEVLILIAFSLLFFLLGTWKKEEVVQ